jgi:hypothetical protein
MVNNLSSAPHHQERFQALQRAVFKSPIWARGWHTTVITEELARFYKTLQLSGIIICKHGLTVCGQYADTGLIDKICPSNLFAPELSPLCR